MYPRRRSRVVEPLSHDGGVTSTLILVPGICLVRADSGQRPRMKALNATGVLRQSPSTTRAKDRSHVGDEGKQLGPMEHGEMQTVPRG